MYINSIGYYLPEKVVPNAYFEQLNGLTDDWIVTRTGIENRRRAGDGETSNSMAIEAVNNAIERLSYHISDIDLIVGASYTPNDTIDTVSVRIQKEFDLTNVISITVSAACSSFVNAMEIVEGYFATGKAQRALVVSSDKNTGYSDDTNKVSGHLWGDGAVAAFVSKDHITPNDIEVIDVLTRGLANIGQGPSGVYLNPVKEGLVMPFGKDVFIHACNFMAEITREIAERNNMTIKDIDYLVPHQANIRIINHVAEDLGIAKDKVIVNIDQCGNTGAASSMIGLAQRIDEIPAGSVMAVSVFGGGYSAGGMLLKK